MALPRWGKVLNIKNKTSHRKLKYPPRGTNSKIWYSLKYLNANGREKCKPCVSISLDQDSVVSQFSQVLANLESGETLWRQEMWGWCKIQVSEMVWGCLVLYFVLGFLWRSIFRYKKPMPHLLPNLHGGNGYGGRRLEEAEHVWVLRVWTVKKLWKSRHHERWWPPPPVSWVPIATSS